MAGRDAGPYFRLLNMTGQRCSSVMQALNHHVERVFNPERKDTHWGKRKLKRDQ
jgi:hypothetical protein